MKRHEQNTKDTWDLSTMYNTNNYDKDIVECWKRVKEIVVYKDKVLSINDICSMLDDYFDLLSIIENISYYYYHMVHVDFNDKTSNLNNSQAQSDFSQMMVELAFVIPKISSVDRKLLFSILEDNTLVQFHKTIRNILNNNDHILDDKCESIISIYQKNISASENIYSVFTNSELMFEDIKDTNNTLYNVTNSSYSNYIFSSDRNLRKNAFNSLFSGYKKYNQTLATIYISHLNNDYICMKNRKYHSYLEYKLSPNKINTSIYSNLLNSVESNIQINHDYIKLRKDILGYEDLQHYDMYVSLVDDISNDYPFETAQNIIINALDSVFNDEYLNVIKDAFSNRWVDKYENEGKRSGAYSGGSYKSYPYILLNYNFKLNDVFTLAHELGHSAHSFFARKHNSYQNAHYKIFVAEVASIVNELILINYLLNNEQNKNVIKYLYNYLLEQFRTTLIRQTMFARFELKAHELVESNQGVNADLFNEEYRNIVNQYFGDEIIDNELIKYEWTRIPHFYSSYYVYQYATCFCCSLNISQRIISNEEGFVDKYIDFLKVGDSVYPLEALKIVDIDLTDSSIFNEGMEQYKKYIALFKSC